MTDIVYSTVHNYYGCIINNYRGYFGGVNFCKKPVTLLKSNFCGSNFHGDSIVSYIYSTDHINHVENLWVEIFMNCRLTTKIAKISTPRK